jgi:hypothetical protein
MLVARVGRTFDINLSHDRSVEHFVIGERRHFHTRAQHDGRLGPNGVRVRTLKERINSKGLPVPRAHRSKLA